MFLLKLFLRAIGALSERGVLIAALILAGTAVAGIQIVEAVLFGRVVNALVEAEPATRVLLTWAVLGALGILINVVLALAADRLAHRNKLKVLVSAFEGALRRPRPVGGEDGSGAVIRTILVGADAFFAAWLSFFRELVPALTALAILFPIAVLMSPALTATLLVLTVLYLAANLFILTRTQSGQREVDAHTRYLASRIGDVMTNASVVHAFTRLAKETEALKVMTRDVLERQYPVLNWWAVLNVFTRASATISVVSVFIVGAFLVGRGELSIGTVVSFAGFAALLIARLEQAAGAITRLFPVAPVMENLLSMLDDAESDIKDRRKPDLAVTHGAIRYETASYTFPGTDVGVHGIDLSIPTGATLALVGSTGSGKSTLTGLLHRVFTATEGRVLIDGQDVAECNADSVRANIATVAQNTGLFDRSIADNLRVGKPDATDEEMLEALERARLGKLLKREADPLSFRIGENGSRLSGGERQRLAIARALLKDAPILLLDEATSALDTVTEREIQKAIDAASTGRTVIVIAHRLSTIANADEIVVLEEGRIVQKGPLARLEREPGPFQRFLAASQERESDAAGERRRTARG